MSFWGELKRRNVFKVGAAYVIVAWLIVQVANTFFPLLSFPKWAVPMVAVLVILGFPLALIHAWAYEVTPDGIKRTKEVPLADSITHLTGKKLNYIVTGLLVAAVAYILFDNFYLDRIAIETEVASRVAELEPPTASEEQEAPKTIAVLPFVNLSSDPEQEYFVDGLTEELLNSLAQIQGLNVTGRTSSFTFKGSNKKAQEIADELGVDHIIEGSVRKAGNDLRITAQLLRGADGFHLWSKTYDRKLENIFEIQEDIATAVADELKLALGVGVSLKQPGGTENVAAYEHYLIALGQENKNIEFSKALASTEAAIALDPNFALAWALKAAAHSGLAIFESAGRAVFELDSALNAAERAIELEPALSGAHCLLGWINTNKGEWIQAELEYRKAIELQTGTLSGLGHLIAFHYNAVGHFKKANKRLNETLRNDPLDSGARGQCILNQAFLGGIRQAEEAYELGLALFGNQWPFGDHFITQVRLGSGDVEYSDIVYSSGIYDSAKEHLDSPKEGLLELHGIYTDDDNLSSEDFLAIAICAAYFGDPEFAMNAMEKMLGIQTSGAFAFWFPVMREVRQLPRFKEFVREIGLVDYWEQYAWPDLCRPLENGDFVCD